MPASAAAAAHWFASNALGRQPSGVFPALNQGFLDGAESGTGEE